MVIYTLLRMFPLGKFAPFGVTLLYANLDDFDIGYRCMY